LVMERMQGEKAGEYFPDLAAPAPEHRRAIGTQLATALAHLHAVPLDALAGTGLDVHASVSEASLSAAVNGMAARIGDLTGPPIAAVPLARQWLLDHIDDVVPSVPLCLLQGDFGLHNTLVEGDRVTALVDWEAATIGPPARELAAAWPAATALMDWSDFVAAYREAGGSPEATDEGAVTFYRVFFGLGACMSSRTGGHLFRTGAKRDLLTAHSGLDAHFRAQRNLVRALTDAGALAAGS
jgi:aminoglycoside phosphotransferase (APT) family kinase protein